MRSAPTLKTWITPCASVAILEKLALLKMAPFKAPSFSKGCRISCNACSAAIRPLIARRIRTDSHARKASSTILLLAMTALADGPAVFNAIPLIRSKTLSVIPKPINISRSTDTFSIVCINSNLDCELQNADRLPSIRECSRTIAQFVDAYACTSILLGSI